jgi:hypothetical protein
MFDCMVDINDIFPNFRADANDPQNYYFRGTDRYVESIRSLGAEMTFRLGYSAEYKDLPPQHNALPKILSTGQRYASTSCAITSKAGTKGFITASGIGKFGTNPTLKTFGWERRNSTTSCMS